MNYESCNYDMMKDYGRRPLLNLSNVYNCCNMSPRLCCGSNMYKNPMYDRPASEMCQCSGCPKCRPGVMWYRK